MTYLLNAENIASAIECMSEQLADKRPDKKEIIRLQLSVEDILLKYLDNGNPKSEFSILVGQRLGKVTIKLVVPGEPFEPISAYDREDGTDFMMKKAMIRMGTLPSWSYRGGRNEINYALSRQHIPDWIKLLGVVAAAIILGLIARFLPAGLVSVLKDGIVEPIIAAFMGFLNAVAGPMIFLSIIWGIYNIGDASTFSRMGKKLGLQYLISLTIIMILTGLVTLPFVHLTFGQGQEGSSVSALYRMLVDIIPSNLVTPFAQGNMLQILFIAVIVGFTLVNISDKVDKVASAIEELNFIVNSIMELIVKLIPVFIFLSLFALVAGSNVKILTETAKYLTLNIFAIAFVLAFFTVTTSIFGKITMVDLWSNTFSAVLIGFMTSSSSAAFSENLNVCKNKLKIRDELVNFGIPFGQILYKSGSAIIYYVTAICFAEIGGVEVSVNWLIMVLFVCELLAIAAPSISGGTTISFSILFTYLGLPAESLAIVLALNVILDFFGTACNIFGVQCSLIIAVKRFNLH